MLQARANLERDQQQQHQQQHQQQKDEQQRRLALEQQRYLQRSHEPRPRQPIRFTPMSVHSPTTTRPNLWNPHNAMQSLEGLPRSPSISSKASSSATLLAAARSKDSLSLPLPAASLATTTTTPPGPMAAARLASSTSARRDAPLPPPPPRPYNPQDFGPSSPSLGPVSGGGPVRRQTGWPLPSRTTPPPLPPLPLPPLPLSPLSLPPLPPPPPPPPPPKLERWDGAAYPYTGYAARRVQGTAASRREVRISPTEFPLPPTGSRRW